MTAVWSRPNGSRTRPSGWEHDFGAFLVRRQEMLWQEIQRVTGLAHAPSRTVDHARPSLRFRAGGARPPMPSANEDVLGLVAHPRMLPGLEGYLARQSHRTRHLWEALDTGICALAPDIQHDRVENGDVKCGTTMANHGLDCRLPKSRRNPPDAGGECMRPCLVCTSPTSHDAAQRPEEFPHASETTYSIGGVTRTREGQQKVALVSTPF
jgi:hypothetical protein